MSIKGKTARHMLTQKLRGSRTSAESRVLLLRNMVTHDEVNIISSSSLSRYSLRALEICSSSKFTLFLFIFSIAYTVFGVLFAG